MAETAVATREDGEDGLVGRARQGEAAALDALVRLHHRAVYEVAYRKGAVDMSTGCEFYTDALVDLAEGRLEAERAARVETHLETCDACREALEVIRTVRAAPTPVPEGLEARIQRAVRGAPATEPEPESEPERVDPGLARWGRRVAWTAVAVAAVVVLWIGGVSISPEPGGDGSAAVEVTVDYDPYGAWPGADGELAGDLVLSELTAEELEALLEEMES